MLAAAAVPLTRFHAFGDPCFPIELDLQSTEYDSELGVPMDSRTWKNDSVTYSSLLIHRFARARDPRALLLRDCLSLVHRCLATTRPNPRPVKLGIQDHQTTLPSLSPLLRKPSRVLQFQVVSNADEQSTN